MVTIFELVVAWLMYESRPVSRTDAFLSLSVCIISLSAFLSVYFSSLFIFSLPSLHFSFSHTLSIPVSLSLSPPFCILSILSICILSICISLSLYSLPLCIFLSPTHTLFLSLYFSLTPSLHFSLLPRNLYQVPRP